MPRRAFTLVEMMVSLAVLTLALSVVGVVFSVTTRSASQAAAYSEALHWARQAAEQLKADLVQCDPASSILVLVGRTRRAGLTADDVAAQRYLRVFTGLPGDTNPSADVGFQTPSGYSEPRADILAFITNRPMASVAPPLNPLPGDPYAGGARLAPALVVYGHAALGEAGWNGANFLWPQTVRHIDEIGEGGVSRIPAAEWHLARRATILRQEDGEPYTFDGDEPASIVACRALDQTPGDAATLNLAGLLAELERRQYARYFSGPYEIYDEDRDLQTWVDGLLYGPAGAPRRHVATVIVPEVPVELRSNLGVHLLPGCTWFQVEFLMPEDPRGSVEYSAALSGGSASGARRSNLSLWTPVEDGQTYVFIPDTRANRDLIVRGNIAAGGQPLGRLAEFARIDQRPELDLDGVDVVASRRIRLWPYAIRVTFHVYDPRGRLKDPIIRTVVHRFE